MEEKKIIIEPTTKRTIITIVQPDLVITQTQEDITPPANNAPTVVITGTSGIVLPVSSVVLTAKGTDTDGTIVMYEWSQVSGPNTAGITNKLTSIATVTNLIEGTYEFKVQVTDNSGGKGAASYTIVVKPAAIPPTTGRKNIIFEALGGPDSGKWDVKGTSTTYGITKATIGGLEATRFEVRRGDPLVALGQRAELNQYSPTTGSPFEVWYGMSYYIPTDWVDDAENLFDIVNQWHDNTFNVAGETEYKSPFDFAVDGKRWSIRTRSGAGNVETTNFLGAVEKGKWVNFVFHIKFVKTGNGIVQIWKDGVKVLDVTKPIGYNHATAPFFKMGIYKWPWNPQDNQKTNSSLHVIYIANLRIGNASATYADVAP